MIELEKKWLLKEMPNLEDHGLKLIKSEMFVQTYLGKNERLRAIDSSLSSEVEYQHFTKTPNGNGSSVEDLTILTEEQYATMLENGVSDILKGRVTFHHEESGLNYEVDLLKFEYPRLDIGILEIEFQDKYGTMEDVDAEFTLPDFMSQYVLLDVTGNPNFTNYSLSIARENGEVMI